MTAETLVLVGLAVVFAVAGLALGLRRRESLKALGRGMRPLRHVSQGVGDQEVDRAARLPEPSPEVLESSFLISDPMHPGSGAVLQVIDEEDSLVAGGTGNRPANNDPRIDYAFDSLVAALPAGVEAVDRSLQAGKMLRIVGPPELLEGLRDGTLDLVDSKGEIIGTVRDLASGEIAGQLRFERLSAINPTGAALVVFQLLAAVTGQYYMNRIDARLASIEKGIDRLEGRHKDDNWAKIDSAKKIAEKTKRLVADGAFRDRIDLPELQHADYMAQEAFFAANRNLRRTSKNWVSSLSEIGDRGDLRPKVGVRRAGTDSEEESGLEVYGVLPGSRRKVRKELLDEMNDRAHSMEDVTMLIDSAVLRARIGMMRVLLEANNDVTRARSLISDYEETRVELISDIEETLNSWRDLQEWDRDELDRLLARWPRVPTDRAKGTKHLKRSLDAACSEIATLETYVEAPEKLIPEVPAKPVEPSVIEMKRTGNGEVEVYAASIRVSGGIQSPR